MDNRFYPYISPAIKARAFDVLDYLNVNRKSFDGLYRVEVFTRLMEECSFLKLTEDELAQAVSVAITIEQRRMHSYRPGQYGKF